MFLSRRSNFFDDIDRTFDSFFDHDDFFSNFTSHDDFFLSKEDQLKKTLSQLHNYENRVHHQIKNHENSIDQLKKTKEQIEQKKAEINQKIAKVQEEKKNQPQNQNQDQTTTTTTSDSKVFKRVHYKTPDMEIEEQYDSHNPQNCYKIIRKQGEAPQILTGAQASQITNETTEKLEPLGGNLDLKFEQLCRLAGKTSSNLRTLVLENKDLTVGQLYDLAAERKLI
ncbi:hypothetical protein ABPG72_003140 [Tetrahymena utriculariae]